MTRLRSLLLAWLLILVLRRLRGLLRMVRRDFESHRSLERQVEATPQALASEVGIAVETMHVHPIGCALII